MYRLSRLIWPYLVLILAAVLILWGQWRSHAFLLRGDAIFHVNQFYESAMQIKTGYLSWFLSLFSFGQAGRVVNAVYGPVFSYLAGGLLLLVGTWFRLQLILEFLVLVLSSFFMYHLSRDLCLGPFLSLCLGLIYSTSYPITTFVSGQAFDGVGNLFIPLVVMAGIKLWRSHQIRALPLAILLAVIFQIHILTVLVSVLVLVPFMLLSFLQSTHKAQWSKRFLELILWFLALTGNVWGSILDLAYRNHVIRPYPNFKMTNPSSALNEVNGIVAPLGYFLAVVIGIAVVLTLINWRSLRLRQFLIPFLAGFYLFLSSQFFPWGSLTREIPAITQVIQFPDRFLGAAVVFSLLTAGLGFHQLSRSSNGLKRTIMFLTLILLVLSAGGSIQNEIVALDTRAQGWADKLVTHNGMGHSQANLSTIYTPFNNDQRGNLRLIYRMLNQSRDFKLALHAMVQPIPDYLPSDRSVTPQNYFRFNPYQLTMTGVYQKRLIQHRIGHSRNTYDQLVRPQSALRFHKAVHGHALTIKWFQPRRLAHRRTILPVVKYHHTVVTDDHHRFQHVSINPIGLVTLRPPTGHHQITVHYQASWLWRIGMVMTIIGWLLAVGYFLMRCFDWKRRINYEKN